MPLALLGIVVAMVVLRERAPQAARPAASARPTGRVGALATLRRLDPRLLAPAYVNFTNLFATSGIVMSTLGVHLKALSGESGAAGWLLPVASLTGVLLALRQVAAIVEAPIAGYLLDRVSDRRAITAAGVALSLAGFLVLVVGQSVVSVIAGVALISMGEGFIAPAVAVWTGEGAPPHLRGVVMGGLATAGDLGSALGPLVGYALFATSGLHAAYALGGGLILSALLVLALVPPRARVSQRA